jgi:uncharacterized protein (TIGR03437 family)
VRRVFTIISIGLGLVRPAAAQFYNLSATDDGASLYFLTFLRQKGIDQNGGPKIFRWDASGPLLLESSVASESISPFDSRHIVSFQVSGDGTVFAFTTARTCIGLICRDPTLYQSVVHTPGGDIALQGIVEMSRNGRYVVTYGNIAPVLHDLATGEDVQITGNTSSAPYGVTNDGRVLLVDAFRLWSRDGSEQQLRSSHPSRKAVIDPAGRTLVYVLPDFSLNSPVYSYDIASGKEMLLGRTRYEVTPSFTNDGSLLAFVNTGGERPQLFVTAPDGSGSRVVTDEPRGILDAVISGDGHLAYAVGGDGSLLRIDVTSGGVTELLPPTPYVTESFFAGSDNRTVGAPAGALIELRGVGLGDGGQLGPTQLDDRPVPTFEDFRFQVPWDTPEGIHRLIIQSTSPFEQDILFPVRQYIPDFLRRVGGDTIIVHEGVSDYVSQSNPAKPGEVITAYMVGLGPTTPPVPTGAPTPIDVSAQVVGDFQCLADAPPLGPLEVLFAGLAPQTIGVYQVNFRAPNVANPPPFVRIFCGWRDARSGGFAVLYLRRN